MFIHDQITEHVQDYSDDILLGFIMLPIVEGENTLDSFFTYIGG